MQFTLHWLLACYSVHVRMKVNKKHQCPPEQYLCSHSLFQLNLNSSWLWTLKRTCTTCNNTAAAAAYMYLYMHVHRVIISSLPKNRFHKSQFLDDFIAKMAATCTGPSKTTVQTYVFTIQLQLTSTYISKSKIHVHVCIVQVWSKTLNKTYCILNLNPLLITERNANQIKPFQNTHRSVTPSTRVI